MSQTKGVGTPTKVGHTPGEWIDDSTGKHYSRRVIRMNGVIVATVTGAGPGLPFSEVEANARLIAAAPNMLAELQDVRRYCPVDVQDRINRLIARATNA